MKHASGSGKASDTQKPRANQAGKLFHFQIEILFVGFALPASTQRA
jgi:hypothetical protein